MTLQAKYTDVVKLNIEEASAFIAKNHLSGVAMKAEALSSYGLRFEGKLIAVAQFCLPTEISLRGYHSVELLRFAVVEKDKAVISAQVIIEFFKKVAKPSDIFTVDYYGNGLQESYEKINFKKVTIKHKPESKSIIQAKEIDNKTLYEWINEDVTFYTYKITATDSEKYYYGVSSIKGKNATKESCAAANYFGSGGVKFRNWRKLHKNSLIKEVISTYPRKAQAYAAEEKLVGELHFSDPLCLNSIKGGRRRIHEVANAVTAELSECEVHGKSLFMRGICSKCSVAKRTNLRECVIHGLQKHQGRACYKCIQEKVAVKGKCIIHGEVSFLGGNCRICIADKSFKMKLCSVHGESPHHGTRCAKCQSENRTYQAECAIHGFTKFQGSSCYKCITNERNTMKECSIHGYTKHSKDSCYKCTVASRYTEKDCPIHGLGKHTKSGCVRCSTRKNFTIKECAIHGETKHNGSTCSLCHAQSISSKRMNASDHQ